MLEQISSQPLSPCSGESTSLHVILAAPRGFCAGVTRAINAVRQALERHGPPVYVRRPIVHNLEVVRSLEAEGAIFVEELDEVPQGSVVLFSAHGVAPLIANDAKDRGLTTYDAVCPLVAKVHREVERYRESGRRIILIGHAGHPEIEGTLGRVEPGAAFVINSVEEVEGLPLERDAPTAYAVQTTYSVDDAEAIVEALRETFSNLVGPSSSDICYATTNRQAACRTIAEMADAMLVVGEQFSSNARRLAEVAAFHCSSVQLLAGPDEIDWELLRKARIVGITSAASTPEHSVEAIIARLRRRYKLSIEAMDAVSEAKSFRPLNLQQP